MKDKIIDLLREHLKQTDGGMNLISMAEKLKIGQVELKSHLTELYKEKKIIVRQGINLKLVYPNE